MALLNKQYNYIKIDSFEYVDNNIIIYYSLYLNKDERKNEIENGDIVQNFINLINVKIKELYELLFARVQLLNLNDIDAKDEESINKCLKSDNVLKQLYDNYNTYYYEKYYLDLYLENAKELPNIPNLLSLSENPKIKEILTNYKCKKIQGSFTIFNSSGDEYTIAKCYDKAKEYLIFEETIDI